LRSICATVLTTLLMSSLSAAQTTSQITTSAQPATLPADSEVQGWTGYAQVQGSSSSLGAVLTDAIDVGYDFTPHFGVSAGLPLFHVRSPFSIVSTTDWRWTTLLGEPWVDAHYTNTRAGIRFLSVLTGTIPLSSNQRVFTTGRFNGDWFNHLEHAYSRFTPFLNAGVSNGTTNRYLLPRPYSEARPYQTLGVMSDFEGGGSFRVHRGYELGVSAYALVPAGSQKVYSRFVSPDSTIAGDGNHSRFFDSALVTTGSSSIDKDNGYTGWLEVTGGRYAGLQIGYTRSAHYRLDIITVVLNFRAGWLFRAPK
jgi:hypothetical protein